MRTLMGSCLAWQLVFVAGAAANEEASPAQKEYDALVKAQRDAQSEFSRAYQAAKTKEEKDAAVKEFGHSRRKTIARDSRTSLRSIRTIRRPWKRSSG